MRLDEESCVKRAYRALMKKISPPEREDKLTNLMEAGEYFTNLLNSPYFQRLSSQIEGELVEQLITTPVDDVLVRDSISTAINIHRKYNAFLLQASEKGRWAKSELEKIWAKEDR
jgi:hypothetical protein